MKQFRPLLLLVALLLQTVALYMANKQASLWREKYFALGKDYEVQVKGLTDQLTMDIDAMQRSSKALGDCTLTMKRVNRVLTVENQLNAARR